MAKNAPLGAYDSRDTNKYIIMKNKKNVFVVKHGNEWATRTAGNQRVTKIFDTQKDAIKVGRQMAINNQSELTIQNKLGRFREKNSYGNDPIKTKG
ncbi:DUF2188 domain-containing protein [Sphingobacterium lactis]|uniref:DUF2188 domain-containing protein n=1 Tax=Sphingobacterium TaxID=28453 RepID=UPI00257C1468|nr:MULTISPECIES: DUF2188 domain-containing protein [Sphingobacterium]